MKIRIGFYIIFTAFIFLLFSCANAIAPNSIDNNTNGHGGGLPSSSDNPLAPFAGSYSSSDGTYDFNDDGTGTMGGANPSARSAGGRTPFTWEITAKDANNANITYGMLYVGNAGSGITFNTSGATITVLINDKVYSKGGMPSGGQQGGQQDDDNAEPDEDQNDDEPDDSTDDDDDTSGDDQQDDSSGGGQQGGNDTPNSGTPESTPTDIGNGMKRLFAPGVTRENGWHDVNKTGNNDSDLCWAATSSNLVAWWQKCYTTLGSSLPTGVKTSDTEIFSLFKTNFGNSSGTYINGLRWYFVEPSSGRGAYLFNCVNPQDWSAYSPKAYKIVEDTSITRRFTTIADFSSEVIAGLKKGAIGLKLTKSGQGGHAITLWGAEYNTSNQIIAVYVTDSDDHSSELKRYELDQKSNSIMLKNYSVDDWQLDKIHGIMILYAP